MPVTSESQDNVRRGAVGDRFYGVRNKETGDIHLAIGSRGDGVSVSDDRRSIIGGVKRDVITMGAGGHRYVADWGGIAAVQVAPGAASGGAYGFMIEKTATGFKYAMRAGFNTQYSGPRPVGTQSKHEGRTLTEEMATMIERDLSVLGGAIVRNFDEI